MNAPTHLMAAAAILARPNDRLRNLAVLFGALAPDLSIFVFYGWMKLGGEKSEREIWGEAYWTEPWQTLGAISNTVPLAAGLFVIALWARALWLRMFALALLIHAALDFPVHAEDAHRHFWPLSDWRFQSPVSYWDPAYNGALGVAAEAAVLFASGFVLWRRFEIICVRIAVAATVLLYAAVGVYWSLAFAGG